MELDQGRNLYNRYFMRFLGVFGVLGTPIARGHISIVLTPDTSVNFSAGEEIFISNEEIDEPFSFFIKSKESNTLFLDRPIDNNYLVGSVIEKITSNMAKNGLTDNASVSVPVIFELRPPPKRDLLLARINFVMELEGQPSESDFGNISQLENGIVFNQLISGTRQTLSQWKKNSDMRLDTGGPDVKFISAKLGYESSGLGGRWTVSKVMSGLELSPVNKDRINIDIQDDISEIISFRAKGQGAVSRTLN